MFRCKCDYTAEIVGYVTVERGAALADFAAFAASIYDNISFFSIRISSHRFKLSQALAGAVSRVYIDVKRP
jgi:hypothetical protein